VVFPYVLFPLSFSLFIIVFICMCIYLSLEVIVCKLFCIFSIYLPGKFSGCFAGGGYGMQHSPSTHTHTLCAYHERGPIPGSV